MTECPICQWVEKEEGILYEDEKVIALTAPTPAVPGHLWIVPRKHTPILEQVPDPVVAELFVKANKISVALFEALGAQGTNMLIQNGVPAGQQHPHTILHVIPRRENDGLNLAWKPRQLDEEEMSTVELKIKEEAKNVGAFEKEESKPVEKEKPKEMEKKEDEYLIKHLRRIP